MLIHGDEVTNTTAPIAMVNEPEPVPQHDEDGSNIEQQVDEMNVARGRAVEAVRDRLDLAQEREHEKEIIALEDMLNLDTSM